MNSRAPGMTLVELLVVAVVGSLVIMAVYQTLSTQERATRHQRALITAQQSSRAALEVLTAELRELSAVGGDITVAAPESVGFRASRKLGFVCRRWPSDRQIEVWERGDPFVAGDSLFLFVDFVTTSSADDEWDVAVVQSVSSPGSGSECPDWILGGTPLPRRRLNLPEGVAIVSDMARGAPVRSFARHTYGLYQVSNEWVLGRRSGESDVVPLIGPLTDDGVVFEYLDAEGQSFTPTTPEEREEIARIRILIRALAPGAVAAGEVVNELESQIFLRNH